MDADKRSRDWARRKAYDEAFLKALDQLSIRDPDRLRKAFVAAMEAQPIDPSSHKFNLGWEKDDEGYRGIQRVLGGYDFKIDSPWGLVLYRTAYDDEAAWQRIVTGIKCNVEIWLQGWEDMLERHQLVIMDDRSQFDGATIDQVRDHFRRWSLEELKRNWRHPPVPEDVLARFDFGYDANKRVHVEGHEPARYHFCLVADALCLESVEWMRDRAVVKLVDKNWEPYEYNPDQLLRLGKRGEKRAWEGGVTDSGEEEVGWMYIEASNYVDMQDELDNDVLFWDEIYLRPPQTRYMVVGRPGVDPTFPTMPGFWRRTRKS
ncbi:hypothetical protein F5144DRAFT_169572 [Chaetomium tenue]|uniref:Uncharacterized protein n=1 Tax=Chaetomium tenue TaxID=1854479 RepID=A0ACB7PEU2_9PEZI|nr:hypothetical protein F5144DRAFT_169572 [Chaetomium globosum]